MQDNKAVIVNSILGQGTFYTGEIHSLELLRIDGNFSGTARSDEIVLIGQHGKAKGLIISPKVVVAGIFQGKIENCDLLVLQSFSIYIGNIDAKKVIIEPGAIIKGKIRTTPNYQKKYIQDDDTSSEVLGHEIRSTRKFNTYMLEKLFDN